MSIINSWSLFNSYPLSWWCHPTISTLSSPSPPTFNLSQNQGLFKWVSSLHQVAEVLESQLHHQSFQWIFRVDFFKYKCIYFNWRLIILQYCVGFAIHQHESATGIHRCSPSQTPLPPPPCTIPLVVPVHQPQATSITHWTWTGDSFHIWYYTCFNAILPNHPTLSLSHRVHKDATKK